MSNDTWLMMDYEAGKCNLEQVGSPVTLPPPDDPDLPVSQQLKRDAMLAYAALGGPEYFRRNPELLDKTLLKMVAEPVQRSELNANVSVTIKYSNPNFNRLPDEPEFGLNAEGEIVMSPSRLSYPGGLAITGRTQKLLLM